jgi:hypothetical protein
MMPTESPDTIPTLSPTLFCVSHSVGLNVGVLSGDSNVPSCPMATDFLGLCGQSVKCRVQHCEVR